MNKRIPDEKHLIGVIGSYGVLNVQELCRKLNGREFKFCHKKHDKWKHIDHRIDNQFVKQCNDCVFHYRDVHKLVMKLIKDKKIKSDKRRFYDRKDDDNNYYPKKKDLFRFVYLDDDVYHKKILSWTLDGYKN